ncbi:hypothetical protein [Saccharothrix obliqua]|uniref:hypothetical protein n=1 Tax=Saccharothrix obliqua TaxID=2861747 RepID=UPI002151488D|nr:hypothetical protein [Saccharothrix obliqua]
MDRPECFGPFLVAAGQHRDHHQDGVVVGRVVGVEGSQEFTPGGQQQRVVRVRCRGDHGVHLRVKRHSRSSGTSSTVPHVDGPMKDKKVSRIADLPPISRADRLG